MNIFKKFSKNKKSSKVIKEYTGLIGLPRLASGEWTEGKFLQAYDKSVYVFACIRKIAETVSRIEFKLFRIKNSKGEIEQILSHPLLDLLENPNPYHSKTKFIKLQQINKLLTGDAYWKKIMVGNKVVELWHLRPDWVSIVPDAQNYVKEYIYRIPGQKEMRFDPEEIIHFNEPSPIKEFVDRTGQSPIRPAQVRVDTEEYATKFQRDFFLNNARLDAVLESDTPLTEQQIESLRQQWNKRYKGVGKNSQIGILEGGLKYKQIATTQKDMDYINGLNATRDDILTIFGVPKSVIAITDDVNRANAEVGLRVFLTENIKPKMKDLIDKLNHSLVPHFGDDLILDCVDPSPEDVELKLKVYENASKYGWMTQNEIREKEGLEPISGGDTPLADKRIPAGQMGGMVPNKKTILLGQPVRTSVFEGRSHFYIRIKSKELEEKLKKQVKKRMEKMSEKKKKEIEKKRKETWLRYLADVDNRKGALLSAIRSFFKGQEKRVFKEISKKQYKSATYFRKYVKKVLDNFDWEEENKKLYAVIKPSMLKIAKLSGRAALKRLNISKPFITEGFIEKWIEKQAEIDASLINKTTRKKLSKQLYEAIEAGEGINEIKERIKNVYKTRGDKEAIRIARTQTGRVVNQATVEAYRQTDVVVKKEWIATMDDRVRPEHAAADGQIVDKNQPFIVGGELKDAPNDINCRCTVAPVIAGEE